MTGIELIAQERYEQINKHGFNESDKDYDEEELIQAAIYALNPMIYTWPNGWGSHFGMKILEKDRVGQLKVAGALIAAEIDRIQNK